MAKFKVYFSITGSITVDAESEDAADSQVQSQIPIAELLRHVDDICVDDVEQLTFDEDDEDEEV